MQHWYYRSIVKIWLKHGGNKNVPANLQVLKKAKQKPSRNESLVKRSTSKFLELTFDATADTKISQSIDARATFEHRIGCCCNSRSHQLITAGVQAYWGQESWGQESWTDE